MPDASVIVFDGEELKESDGGWRSDRHYVASFNPQAWVNDYAVDVDCEGPKAWDASNFIGGSFAGSEESRSSMLKNNSDASDSLQSDPAAPQWVRDHGGPFTVSVYAYVDALSAQQAADAINGVVAPQPNPGRRPGL